MPKSSLKDFKDKNSWNIKVYSGKSEEIRREEKEGEKRERIKIKVKSSQT